MKKFFGNAAMVVSFLVLVYGGYIFYEKWWKSGEAGDFLKKTEEKTSEIIDKSKNEYADKIKETAQKNAKDYLKGKTADALAFIGEKLVNTADSLSGNKSEINPFAQTASNETIKAVGPTFLIPPPPATIVAKINTSLVFSLNSGESYNIDWGDEASENGSLTADQSKLVSHAWQTVGDYNVKIDIKSGSDNSGYSFAIRVY